MQELDISLDRVIKIWWLQAWRISAVGIVFMIVTLLGELYVPDVAAYIKIFGLIFMLGWNLKVTKMALQKRYEDFRVALVPLDAQ